MTDISIHLFLIILGLIAIVIIIYSILRMIFAKQRGLLLASKGFVPHSEKRDNIGFIVDTFHDMVKELKEKEQELQRFRAIAEERAESMESYNENILRSVSSGVITFDKEGRIITFNPAAEGILSKRAEDIIGKRCEEVFGEENPITIVQKVTLEKGEGIPRMEVNIEKAQGEKIWLGMNTSLLKNRDDELIGLILVFSDLTEIKNLQGQMELKERFTLLGEMSAGIAHELRNPMGAISGFAKLLSKSLEENDERRSLAYAIEKEIEGMNRVISELLNFTRPADLNLSEIDLNSLIEDSLRTLTLNNIEVTLNLDPIPRIMADEVLLRQAFINLFQNAIEAMPEGGKLKIVTSLKLQVQSQNLWVEIQVSDTGMGISKDNLKKIFHPFFTTKDRGTGLGLPLVQKIILYHGGSIGVESIEGRGTTFRIDLPIRNREGNL